MASLTGCGGGLRARAASEFGCQPEDVTITRLGAGGYRAFGCGQSATYVCTTTNVCIRESGSGPASGGSGGGIPSGASADGIKMQAIESDDVRYEMPEWFKLDEDSKEKVYRDDNKHHAVRLTVEATDADEKAWIEEHYPGAEQWTESVAGREVYFATKVGKKLRVTVSVIAVTGRIFELACTSDDLKKPKPDVTCSAIVRSLRTRAMPKAAGSTI